MPLANLQLRCPNVAVTAVIVVIVFAGPVAFVMATLFEDFKKKFHAWVESV